MILKNCLTGDTVKEPSFQEAYEMLCQHAGEKGRSEALFGDSLPRVREAAPPFLTGMMFPEVYFEFPLSGDPFLDVSIFYGKIKPGMKIGSWDKGSGILDWVADTQKKYRDIAVCFELDTHLKDHKTPGIIFEPRRAYETIKPFCDLIGESETAELYLDMCDRMKNAWPLSYFGIFRGRDSSPLRISGYLTKEEKEAYSNDPSAIAKVFDIIGFTAYSSQMLSLISKIMCIAPDFLEFQLDVYPDHTMGDKFSLDVHIKDRQTDAIIEALSNGPISEIINIWKDLGVADDRISLVK